MTASATSTGMARSAPAPLPPGAAAAPSALFPQPAAAKTEASASACQDGLELRRGRRCHSAPKAASSCARAAARLNFACTTCASAPV